MMAVVRVGVGVHAARGGGRGSYYTAGPPGPGADCESRCLTTTSYYYYYYSTVDFGLKKKRK